LCAWQGGGGCSAWAHVPTIDAAPSAAMVKVYLCVLVLLFPTGEPDSIEPRVMAFPQMLGVAAIRLRAAAFVERAAMARPKQLVYRDGRTPSSSIARPSLCTRTLPNGSMRGGKRKQGA
jgi:hypothetical protein